MRSTSRLTESISSVLTKRKLDDAALDEFAETLLKADLGLATATAITNRLAAGRHDREIAETEVKTILAAEIGGTRGEIVTARITGRTDRALIATPLAAAA